MNRLIPLLTGRASSGENTGRSPVEHSGNIGTIDPRQLNIPPQAIERPLL